MANSLFCNIYSQCSVYSTNCDFVSEPTAGYEGKKLTSLEYLLKILSNNGTFPSTPDIGYCDGNIGKKELAGLPVFILQ